MSRVLRATQLLHAAVRHRRNMRLERGPRAVLEAHQRARLAEVAREAAARSRFYAEHYRGIELSGELPPVTKEELMGRFDDWVVPGAPRLAEAEAHIATISGDAILDGYRVMASSGMSGRRGIFVFDRDEWTDCLVAYMRWSDMLGLRPKLRARPRVATVGASSPLHQTARFGTSIDVGLQPVLRLDASAPLPETVARLADFGPTALLGYSSAMALLAEEQLAGRLAIAPAVVATMSEVRTPDMTGRIRAAWGAEPFDLFGSTETVYGCDCEHHAGIHIFEDACLVEVVDAEHRPVPDGQPGHHLLVTSFVKRTQPIIRYVVGDIAALTREPCACGRSFARFVSLEGRSDDIVRLPAPGGGEVAVHPLALRSPLAGLDGLREYRIVVSPTELVLELAARDGADIAAVAATATTRLHDALAAAGAQPPPIRAELHDALPRASMPGGKFKLIEVRSGSASGSGRRP